MDAIPRQHHYTFRFVRASTDTTQSPYKMQADGFALEISLQNRFVILNNNSKALCRITRDPSPREMLFLVSRFNVLSRNDPGLSYLFKFLRLPFEEHQKLMNQVCDFAADLRFYRQNDPPKLVPINIEIVKWTTLGVNQPVINESLMNDSQSDLCSICLESVGSDVTQLPCNHKFDLLCILGWISSNRACPICRFEVPVQD